MSNLIEQIAALTIGTVESVSPSGIKVLLEPNAPQTTALNTGAPTRFPRINGYILIPNETGAVVGLVVWLGVERSQFPKRKGLKDFGLVDLPFPLRKISLAPLGTLIPGRHHETTKSSYYLERGVSVFPSIGDSAQLPTEEQLRCIIEPSLKEDRRVKIGTSPLSGNTSVTVDPDKIFGRHLAVLGNTGSGKSCSVAGLIRWSINSAKKSKKGEKSTNAHFIILDPNGEYSKAFADYEGVHRFQITPKEEGVEPLYLPAWMWNSHEWCAFTEASSRVQKPILMRALRELRSIESTKTDEDETILPIRLRHFYNSLIKDQASGPTAYMDFPGKQNFGDKLRTIVESIKFFSQNYPEHEECLVELHEKVNKVYKSPNAQGFYPAFSEGDVQSLIDAFEVVITALPVPENDVRISEDCPIKFDVADLATTIEEIATEQGQLQFVDTLLLRVRMLLSDERMQTVVSPEKDIDISTWLNAVMCQNTSEHGSISILDLSLLPSDILHTIIAVVARIIFETTKRYRKLYDAELPLVLVLEEAHAFVKSGSREDSDTPTPAQMCRQTFERIAREGRKFGLGLVLSSQRPSELSQTVLAQCNTFLLHRIVNGGDQDLVSRLVPDNVRGVLQELPSLPSRQAVLLGWAATVPTLVEITELPKEQRPRSSDPKFWDVWTGKEERPINWHQIMEEWTGIPGETKSSEELDDQDILNEEEKEITE